MKKNLYYIFTVVFAILLAGCATTQPNEDVYIPKDYNKIAEKSDQDYGMREGWVKSEDIKSYDKVKINVFVNKKQYPVSWWDRQSVRSLVSSNKYDEDYVAEYTKKSLADALGKNSGLAVTNKSGSDTLEIDFAIVQVIPNQILINSVTNVLGLTPIGLLLSPVKVMIKGGSESNGGAVAMETMVKNSENGKIEAVFADREKGKSALLINFNEFLAYSNVRVIIDNWTSDIALALNDARNGKQFNPKYQHQFVLADY